MIFDRRCYVSVIIVALSPTLVWTIDKENPNKLSEHHRAVHDGNVTEHNENQNDIDRLQLPENREQNTLRNDAKMINETKKLWSKFNMKTSKSTDVWSKYIPKFSPLFSTSSDTPKTTTTRERIRRSFQTLKTTEESLSKISRKFSPLFSTTRRKKKISRSTVKIPESTKKSSSRYSLRTFKAYRASNILRQSSFWFNKELEFTTKKSRIRFNINPAFNKKSSVRFIKKKPAASTTDQASTTERPVYKTTQSNASTSPDEKQFDKQLEQEASDATYNCVKEMTLDYKLSPKKMQELFRIGRRYDGDTVMISCLVLGNTYRAGLATLKETYAMRPRYASWMQFEAGYLVYDMSLKYQSLIELYYLAYTKMSEDKAPIRYMFYMYRLMTSLGALITHMYYMLTFMKIKHSPDQVPYEDIADINNYNNKKYGESWNDYFKDKKISYKDLIFAEIDKKINQQDTNSSSLTAEELERIKKIRDLMKKMELDRKRRLKLEELHLYKINTPATYNRIPTRYYSKKRRNYTYGWSVELDVSNDVYIGLG